MHLCGEPSALENPEREEDDYPRRPTDTSDVHTFPAPITFVPTWALERLAEPGIKLEGEKKGKEEGAPK